MLAHDIAHDYYTHGIGMYYFFLFVQDYSYLVKMSRCINVALRIS